MVVKSTYIKSYYTKVKSITLTTHLDIYDDTKKSRHVINVGSSTGNRCRINLANMGTL